MIVFLFTTSARRCLMYARGTVGDVLWSLLFKWATLFLKVSNHCTWTPKSRITNGFQCKWRARLTHSTDFIWRKAARTQIERSTIWNNINETKFHVYPFQKKTKKKQLNNKTNRRNQIYSWPGVRLYANTIANPFNDKNTFNYSQFQNYWHPPIEYLTVVLTEEAKDSIFFHPNSYGNSHEGWQ